MICWGRNSQSLDHRENKKSRDFLDRPRSEGGCTGTLEGNYDETRVCVLGWQARESQGTSSNALEVTEVRLHGKVESRPMVTIQCACCLGNLSKGILPRVWMEAGRCFMCGVFALSVSFS